jgi:hypothetical protein
MRPRVVGRDLLCAQPSCGRRLPGVTVVAAVQLEGERRAVDLLALDRAWARSTAWRLSARALREADFVVGRRPWSRIARVGGDRGRLPVGHAYVRLLGAADRSRPLVCPHCGTPQDLDAIGAPALYESGRAGFYVVDDAGRLVERNGVTVAPGDPPR